MVPKERTDLKSSFVVRIATESEMNRLKDKLLENKTALNDLLSAKSRLETKLSAATREIQERRAEIDQYNQSVKLRVISSLTTRNLTSHHEDEEKRVTSTRRVTVEETTTVQPKRPPTPPPEDWTPGETSRTALRKNVSKYGDGNVRVYELASPSVPRGIDDVRETIWYSTASKLRNQNSSVTKEMLDKIFVDLDKYMTPYSISERRAIRKGGGRKKKTRRRRRVSSSNSDDSATTKSNKGTPPSSSSPGSRRHVKKLKTHTVHVAPFANRTPLIEDTSDPKRELIHEADRTKLHMSYILLSRMASRWATNAVDFKKEWAVRLTRTRRLGRASSLSRSLTRSIRHILSPTSCARERPSNRTSSFVRVGASST